MRKFGLIGFPLGHSFSKKFFSEKFEKESLVDCSYENYPLTSLIQFKKLVAEIYDLCGLNVTIPYKSEIIQYIDTIDPEAGEIGAVNVLKIKRRDNDIKIHGYNSDVTGIRDTLSPWLNNDVNQALVLGTGGSSLAVRFVLKKLGIRVIQVSRNKNPGVIDYQNISSDIINNCKLIINTTPLGMFPDINSKPDLNYKLLTDKHILFDLVYNPELTSFLRSGQERGCKTLGGLTMLWSQAEKSWQIWNDPEY